MKKENASEQISFFGTPHIGNKKEEKLEKAIDNIRQKYGSDVIVAGGIMDRELGIYRKKETGENGSEPD